MIPKWVKVGEDGKVKCPKCSDGYHETIEDGRLIPSDACYHCATTGRIELSLFLSDLVKDLAGSMASAEIELRINEINNDPSGEGWAFMAAENMITTEALTMGELAAAEDRIMEDLRKLNDNTLWLLVDQFYKSIDGAMGTIETEQSHDPSGDAWREAPRKDTTQPPVIAPDKVSFKEDDIPF